VNISWIPRSKAEQTYGFRLYQGGVVPNKELRIVNIQGWDVEACGGTHCSATGDIGLIKIVKSERVQDGVERLEFVAGEAAVKYIQKQESILIESAAKLETPIEKLSASISNLKTGEESARRTSKQLAKRLSDVMISEIPKLSKELPGGVRLYISTPAQEEGLDAEYHLTVGERLSKEEQSVVYIAIFVEREKTRLMVFCGGLAQQNGVKAGTLVREIAKKMGGSGGGDSRFGQGGVQDLAPTIPNIEEIVLSLMVPNSSSVGKH